MRRIVYSRHAEVMLVEREIDRAWVERAIDAPDQTEPDASRPEAMRAFRAIAENDGRVLRVVYVRDGEDYRVITVFFDLGRRP